MLPLVISTSPVANPKTPKSKEELKQFVQALNLYEPLLTDDEVADRLGYVLNSVMRQSAYDDGLTAISNYRPIIDDEYSRREIASSIEKEVFDKQVKLQDLDSLANFLTQVTAHAGRIGQYGLIKLCQEILSLALKSANYGFALLLWSKITHLEWAKSETWFDVAIGAISHIKTTEEFVFIVDEIGCPAYQESLSVLGNLLIRSKGLQRKLYKSITFLQNPLSGGVEEYLMQVLRLLQRNPKLQVASRLNNFW